jgi:hypothetical protein
MLGTTRCRFSDVISGRVLSRVESICLFELCDDVTPAFGGECVENGLDMLSPLCGPYLSIFSQLAYRFLPCALTYIKDSALVSGFQKVGW